MGSVNKPCDLNINIVKNPVILTDTKIQDQKPQPREAKSLPNQTTVELLQMAIKISITMFIAFCLFLFLFPSNHKNLSHAMKFKRICYLSLDLPPYKTKSIGPTTRDVLEIDNKESSSNFKSTIREQFNAFKLYEPSGQPVFDPKYCTHINVIPGSFDTKGNILPASPSDVQKYKDINSLRTFNPSLKILIAICGTNLDWGIVVSSNETRLTFAKNLNKFITTHGFDGADFDWEFPVYSSFKWGERNNFIELLKAVRSSFDSESSNVNRGNLVDRFSSSRSKKLLTIDVPGDVTIVLPGYDIVSINSIVDWINVMTYDLFMYKPFYPFTGFNGALFPKKSQGYYFSTLNLASAAYLWNNLGMDKDKIVLGVPTYARSYLLLLPSLNYVGAPAVREGNVYSFGDVCDILLKNGTTKVFDTEAKVPYAYNGDIWISYEDVQSATEKAMFIKENKFAGSMTFSLNSDDFDGRCDKVKQAGLMGDVSQEDDGIGDNGSKFLIHKALYNVLK